MFSTPSPSPLPVSKKWKPHDTKYRIGNQNDTRVLGGVPFFSLGVASCNGFVRVYDDETPPIVL